MKQKQSDPHLIQILTMGLQAWCNGTPPPDDLMVAWQQLLVGWDSALNDCLG